MVVGTWTAFETMAGDLWVATVNANPRLLARLAGTEKRIHKQAKAALQKDSGDAGKQEAGMGVPVQRLHDITNGKYNISNVMGELLKSKVSFTTLWDIRRAYSVAFDERTVDRRVVNAVDGALADGSLDALAAVRNVIVHKAGVCDAEYVKRVAVAQKAGVAIPLLEERQLLQLDGEIVKSLTDPVVACCLKLFVAIDGWLDKNLSPPGYTAGLGI